MVSSSGAIDPYSPGLREIPSVQALCTAQAVDVLCDFISKRIRPVMTGLRQGIKPLETIAEVRR